MKPREWWVDRGENRTDADGDMFTNLEAYYKPKYSDLIHVREVMPLSDEMKRHFKALVRRRGYLRNRIKENPNNVKLIHDEREEEALTWVIAALGDRPLAPDAGGRDE